MTWFGRSGLGLLTLWVLLSPVDRALAQDAGVVEIGLIGTGGFRGDLSRPAQVLSPGAPIPANGGILIESSDGSKVVAIVTAPGGVRVEGTTTLLSMPNAAYFAWTPTAEISLGAYQVDLMNEDGLPRSSASTVEITAAADRAKPEVDWSPSISEFTESAAEICCAPLNEGDGVPCTFSGQRTLALLDPGLSSTETVGKLNQFLFAARIAEGAPASSSSASFGPFGASVALHFKEAADEYCVELVALDIVTLDEHTYPDLTRCVASSHVRFGTVPIELDDAFFADELCEQPPRGHEERWCEVNAGACEDATTRCGLFRYACEDGPWPYTEIDAGVFGNDVIRIPDGTSSGDCSVSAPGGRAHDSPLTQLAILALLLRRSRSATRRANECLDSKTENA